MNVDVLAAVCVVLFVAWLLTVGASIYATRMHEAQKRWYVPVHDPPTHVEVTPNVDPPYDQDACDNDA